MLRLLFSLILLSLSGCGQDWNCNYINKRQAATQPAAPCTVAALFTRVHPSTSFQVQHFSNTAQAYNVPCYKTLTLAVTDNLIKDTPPEVLAYCQFPLTVTVRKAVWDAASATTRLGIIYHELGHCSLQLGHYDDSPDIMNSYLLHDDYMDKHWDVLVNTMFERVKQ
jgi:hypothetical protein